MRFDDYRCQLRAVQAPAGWEEAVRARIAAAPAPAASAAPAPAPPAASAAPASAPPPESSAPLVSAPRRPFRLRLVAAALAAAVALALGGAGALAGLAGPDPAASLVAPPAEALDLATPALRLDPDAGLSFQLADGCARVRLRAEFRCRNAGEGPTRWRCTATAWPSTRGARRSTTRRLRRSPSSRGARLGATWWWRCRSWTWRPPRRQSQS